MTILSEMPAVADRLLERGLYEPILLKDALVDLTQTTGVDFSRFYCARYDINPDSAAKGYTKEPVMEKLDPEKFADLAPYFRTDAKNRRYFRLLEAAYYTSKPEQDLRDYLLMEQDLDGGETVFCIFDYPAKEPFHTRPIQLPGHGLKVEVSFLNLRFAGMIDHPDLADRSQDTVRVLVDRPESLETNNKQREAGLLPLHHEVASLDKAAALVKGKRLLLKDVDGLMETVITDEGEEKLAWGGVWNHFASEALASDPRIQELMKRTEANLPEMLSKGEITGAAWQDIQQILAVYQPGRFKDLLQEAMEKIIPSHPGNLKEAVAAVAGRFPLPKILRPS